MNLSDAGESRVRGYLYVLERSLRATVSAPLAADAVREVESHIRERVAESNGMPNERAAIEHILTQLGSPTTVARAYSLELMMEEAEVGGRFVAVIRSLFHMAAAGVLAFFGAIALFIGYTLGISFILVAILKPIFPGNVGVWMLGGFPVALGAQFPAPSAPLGGYWIVPISLTLGFGIVLMTHRAARRWIAATRSRFARSLPGRT